MPATYEPIATTTLGSTSTLVTFSSIPATYTDLFVACQIKRTSSTLNFRITLNNDSSTLYSLTRMVGTSNVAATDRLASQPYFTPWWNGGAFTNTSSFNFNLMNYANTTTNKSVLFTNAEGGSEITVSSGLYRSTSAINRIDFTAGSNSFAIGCTFTIYGIKAA